MSSTASLVHRTFMNISAPKPFLTCRSPCESSLKTPPPLPSRDLLSALPTEIILTIASYLDINDVYALSKTSHRLRTISQDPVLQKKRLRCARSFLSQALPKRPSLDSLRPPNRRIYMSGRDITTRSLAQSLTRVKLNRQLQNRTDPETLIEKGVLPAKYLRKRASASVASVSARRMIPPGESYSYTISPSLLPTCVELENKLVRANLRRLVGSKKIGGRRRNPGPVSTKTERGYWGVINGKRPSVKYLAARWVEKAHGVRDERWGKIAKEREERWRRRTVGIEEAVLPKTRVAVLRQHFEHLTQRRWSNAAQL